MKFRYEEGALMKKSALSRGAYSTVALTCRVSVCV